MWTNTWGRDGGGGGAAALLLCPHEQREDRMCMRRLDNDVLIPGWVFNVYQMQAGCSSAKNSGPREPDAAPGRRPMRPYKGPRGGQDQDVDTDTVGRETTAAVAAPRRPRLTVPEIARRDRRPRTLTVGPTGTTVITAAQKTTCPDTFILCISVFECVVGFAMH